MSEHVDVIIIGSGTAGLSAMREVRKKTEDFLLVNDGSWGTTCAAVGCMPSKALVCLLYTSPSPRDGLLSRMPSSA